MHYHVVFEELLGYLQFGICRTAPQVFSHALFPAQGRAVLLPVQTFLALSSLLPSGLGKAAALPHLPLSAPGKLQLIGRSISDMSLLPGMVEIPQSQGYQLSWAQTEEGIEFNYLFHSTQNIVHSHLFWCFVLLMFSILLMFCSFFFSVCPLIKCWWCFPTVFSWSLFHSYTLDNFPGILSKDFCLFRGVITILLAALIPFSDLQVIRELTQVLGYLGVVLWMGRGRRMCSFTLHVQCSWPIHH